MPKREQAFREISIRRYYDEVALALSLSPQVVGIHRANLEGTDQSTANFESIG